MEEKKASRFMGFPTPSQNYSKLPHAFIDVLPEIDSMAEMKVVIYLLRHTWGFSEYGKPKKITTDEFMNGRKRRDGSRLDKGTGLAKGSVITGLEKAVEHGFILVEVDDTDKARIEKYYSLSMSDVQDLNTDVQDLDNRGSKVGQRSEKETKERKVNQQQEDATQNIFTVYTQEIGLLTPIIADGLEDWEKLVGPKWICDAISEAAKSNARNWKYVEAILKRWKAQGNQEAVKKQAKTNGKPSTPSVADSWLARKERELANGNT